MFVRIYPFLRLPRRFGVFDYRAPVGMQFSVGDVVTVPFHGRQILGVVAACSETTEVRSKVAEVTDIFLPNALSVEDIRRFEMLANKIAQSPSTLLFSTFGRLVGDHAAPQLAKPTSASLALPIDMVEAISATAKSTAKTTICQMSTEATFALAQIIQRRTNEQVLIVVPRERDAERLSRLINFVDGAAVLHGHTKPKERERIAHAWRQGTLRTLIGTLQATLLPAKRLSHVLVHTTGVDDHFSDRRNPRLDTRLSAEAQAIQHQARLILCDDLPRPEDVLAGQDDLVFSQSSDAIILDLRRQEESSGRELLSESLLAEIKKALQSQKKVLLFYNRKGVAGRAQCRNCGHIITCAICGSLPRLREANCECPRCNHAFAIPEFCPSCTHGKLGLKGIGNAHIEKDLVALFPEARVTRIEKGHGPDTTANILLVTEYFFSSVTTPFAKKEFGLVADLCVDLSMNPEDFRAVETTARKLHRLSHFAKQQGAVCIAQTWMPEAIEAMRDARQFLNAEISVRQQYGLPPATALVTVRHADAEALRAITDASFIPNEEILGAMARITYDKLSSALSALGTLPDTAVISVDQTYERPRRTPQS